MKRRLASKTREHLSLFGAINSFEVLDHWRLRIYQQFSHNKPLYRLGSWSCWNQSSISALSCMSRISCPQGSKHTADSKRSLCSLGCHNLVRLADRQLRTSGSRTDRSCRRADRTLRFWIESWSLRNLAHWSTSIRWCRGRRKLLWLGLWVSTRRQIEAQKAFDHRSKARPGPNTLTQGDTPLFHR